MEKGVSKDILIENECGQVRLALLEGGELTEYYVERRGQEKLSGNIYAGRVVNILPGMQAAFVDIGLEKNAFLHAGDILDFGDKSISQRLGDTSIGRMVKPGQELLVQVVKEPGGDKGPRISSHVTLPGRLIVLLPTVEYVGVSRKIGEAEERSRLKELAEELRPEGMGVVVRTAALNASREELTRDIQTLLRLWNSIRVRGEHSRAPALVHRDGSLVYRAVRDMLDGGVRAMLIEDKALYESAREAAETLSPEWTDRIQLYEKDTPLFDIYRVDAQLKKACARRVWLKSGGFLVIDYTEALTVIDVNTGKYVGGKTLAETVFKLNCEAAEEIARQLRLRDMGGIIVVDFIDMEDPAHREALLSLLKRLLRLDRTKTTLVGMTDLGLVELTRKKVRQPIHTFMGRPCPCCQGGGVVLTDETLARAALHDLRARAALSAQDNCWLIRAPLGVAGQLMLIGTVDGIKAYAHGDSSLPSGTYEIERVSEGALPAKARRLPECP